MLHMSTYVLENSVTSHTAVKHRHTFTTLCLELKEFIACMVFLFLGHIIYYVFFLVLIHSHYNSEACGQAWNFRG